MPPPAPAPGRLADASPRAASRRSSSATCCGLAPFCGPYTAAAPAAPSSGLSTSSAATSDTPSGTLPSARRSPAPPSVVAVPPTPTTIRVPPSAIARPISSPAPSDVAASGSGARSATRHMPQASATSSAASPPPRSAYRASIGRPRASCAGAARQVPPRAASSAAAVPSPPSASGTSAQIVLPARAPSPRQRPRRLIGGVGALQLVRRDHDPHPRDPIRWRGSWCWWPSTRRSPAPPAAAPAAPPTRA